MTEKRKGARRYKKTTESGLTLSTYTPSKNHKKLPAVVYVYTKAELEEFARSRGMRASHESD